MHSVQTLEAIATSEKQNKSKLIAKELAPKF